MFTLMPTLRDFRLLATKEDWDIDSMKILLYIWLATGHLDDVWITQDALNKAVDITRVQEQKRKEALQ
jgi:hypothetical protein